MKTSSNYVVMIIISAALVLGTMGLPRLRLVGAGTTASGRYFAILEDTGSGKQDVYEQNAMAFQKYQIIKIEEDRITVKDGQENYTFDSRGMLKTTSPNESRDIFADDEPDDEDLAEAEEIELEETNELSSPHLAQAAMMSGNLEMLNFQQ